MDSIVEYLTSSGGYARMKELRAAGFQIPRDIGPSRAGTHRTGNAPILCLLADNIAVKMG